MPYKFRETIFSNGLAVWAMFLLHSLCLLDAAHGEQPTPVQIDRWIQELEDDRYAVREAAQLQLTAASQVALHAVAATAADLDTSLESTVRTIRILTDWSVSKDASLRIAALESLAALKNRPLEAAQAAEQLAAVRELAAIEAIVRLGGICEPVAGIPGNAQIVQGNARLLVQYKNQQLLRITIGTLWKGTDEDLKEITKIRRAYIVGLHSAPVGDGALEHLADIPNLKRVEIYGTKFSPDALTALRKKLPESIPIDIRSGAKLGIRGRQGQGGASIIEVQPGSAAEKAGLKLNDVITHVEEVAVGNEKIDDFISLTKLIAGYQPGETVDFTVVRAGKSISIPVKFGRWGINNKADNKKARLRLEIPEPR